MKPLLKPFLHFFPYIILFAVVTGAVRAQSDGLFRIFQFPADQIPRIDGNSGDWSMVPETYCIGTEYLSDDERIHPAPDTADLDIKVYVGWVKGLDRLYFLYEARDNYWDFSRTDLHHDIFELVVDGDRSGGPLIAQFHPHSASMDPWEAYFSFHGVQAQNYHIFTPAEGQDWCLAWGSQPWIKELPWANHAYSYTFRPGESGKLIMEFWITPFDYAGTEGPSRAVTSKLTENKDIGLSWAVIDFDDVNAEKNNGFWNLSDSHTMYGNASRLKTFRLMPLEEEFRDRIYADWSFTVIDINRRLVAFRDLSCGEITRWKWDFGDGTLSEEQHPVHHYEKAGRYIVTLYIEGPEGSARMAKVWDVALR